MTDGMVIFNNIKKIIYLHSTNKKINIFALSSPNPMTG